MSSLSRVHQFSDTTINVPTLLAAAISVGLHGLIWIVEPTLSSSKTSSDGQRTVGVVQLTPSEMSRLPEYSLAQSYLPNVPVPPPPTNLLPPLPSVQAYPPVLPPISTYPTYIPPVSQSPSSNGVRGRSQVTIPETPELSSKERQSKPSSESSKPQSTNDDSGKPLQSDSSLSPKAQLGSDGLKESIERYLAQQDSLNARTNTSTGNEEGNKPTQSNNRQPDDRTSSRVTENIPKPTQSNNQRSSATGNREKPPASSNQPSSSRLPLGVTEGMLPNTAFVPRSNQTASTTERGNTSISPENLRTHLPSFYQQESSSGAVLEKPTASGSRSLTENQKNALAFGTLSTWLEDRRSQFSRDLMPVPMPDRVFVKSPLKVKLPSITVASVIVLVNPEGKKIGDAELIRSTGDSRLDRAAIDNIQKRSSPPPTGKYEAYLYQIEIDQDGLPAATTGSPKR